MGTYSIKELEKLSGIKAHTIRIWEKRHQIINPLRTETNIRYYSDDDLKKIINISLLNNRGVKISKIANLTLQELQERVTQLSADKGDADIHVDQLIVAMIGLDEEVFEKTLSGLIVRYGFESTITEIVYPFLEKIGLLWQTGNITPAQEHFISNLVRQKIIVAIDSLPLAPNSSTRVVLFLPEDELHELGLLFYYYVTKKAGFRAYYLGQMVPYKDLISVCQSHQPKIIITAITGTPSGQSVQGLLARLCKERPQSVILATGLSLRKTALKIPSNLHIFSDIVGLKEHLKNARR